MRPLQFFLQLFEKPRERSIVNAGACYFIILLLFGALVSLYFGTVATEIESTGEPAPVLAMLTLGWLMVRLFEQASEWLHPKVRRNRDYHRWR